MIKYLRPNSKPRHHEGKNYINTKTKYLQLPPEKHSIKNIKR